MTTAESSPATISERVDVYDARVGWRNLLPDWRALYGFRHLLRNLVIRDLKVRYKSSLLGVVWSLLNPLLMMVVFTLVFGVLAGNDIRDYSVFFLVGLLPWNFFNGALLGSTLSITANAALVKKVYFPRELLPLASIFSNLVNFGIALIVLVVFLYATGLGLTVHALWVIPLLITQIIFTLGLGLLLGSLQVFYRDVMMILDVVMLAWFFLTPVMYSLSRFGTQAVILGMELVPEQVIRWLNPMASIIDGYRTVLWGVMTPGGVTSPGPVAMDPLYLLRTFITAVIVLLIGYFVFARTEHLFGEAL
ncbi:MAG: ABC transporter permease [Chloroflexi bacterium]|nr:ABC transporter permease [Chloroflexota bacterium]